MGFVDLTQIGLLYIGLSSVAIGLYLLRTGTKLATRVAFLASLLNLVVAGYLFVAG